jgi:hypothetical protein
VEIRLLFSVFIPFSPRIKLKGINAWMNSVAPSPGVVPARFNPRIHLQGEGGFEKHLLL